MNEKIALPALVVTAPMVVCVLVPGRCGKGLNYINTLRGLLIAALVYPHPTNPSMLPSINSQEDALAPTGTDGIQRAKYLLCGALTTRDLDLDYSTQLCGGRCTAHKKLNFSALNAFCSSQSNLPQSGIHTQKCPKHQFDTSLEFSSPVDCLCNQRPRHV